MNAAMREAANAMRQLYVALVAEEFTANEALEIIGHILKGNS